MIIQITPDWRIASDPLQWILQHRYTKKGEDAWRSIGFFIDLERACVELARRQVHQLQGTYGPEALKPLSDALITIKDDARAALRSFKIEAGAYHGKAGS